MPVSSSPHVDELHVPKRLRSCLIMSDSVMQHAYPQHYPLPLGDCNSWIPVSSHSATSPLSMFVSGKSDRPAASTSPDVSCPHSCLCASVVCSASHISLTFYALLLTSHHLAFSSLTSQSVIVDPVCLAVIVPPFFPVSSR